MTWPEVLRKLAHMAAFWPALLLPWLTPGLAMAITFGLILMNLFILPRLATILYRPFAAGRGALEIILYPCAILATLTAFGLYPGQTGDTLGAAIMGKPAWYLPVATAWFGLACVDACIGIACRLLPHGPTFPWNNRKPILAVALGALTACIPAWLLIKWAMPLTLASYGWAWLLGLVMFSALAETVWFGIADNIVIPFAISVVFPFLPISPFIVQAGTENWIFLLIPIGFGLVAYFAGLLTLGGSILGALLTLLLMLGNPWLFIFLGGFFLLGNLATRLGIKSKQVRGIAEPRSGRRGAAEVFGAMGMAVWMTPLLHFSRAESNEVKHITLLICIAPLVAKTMDTVSSEIGKALAGKTWSVINFRRVAPGANGAVSVAGTLWGLVAALILALPLLALHWGGFKDVCVLLIIALIANLFEAFWKEWAGPQGLDQGAHANVLMTLVAAVLAWIWWLGLS